MDLCLHGPDLRLAGLGVHGVAHLFGQLDFFLPEHDLVSVEEGARVRLGSEGASPVLLCTHPLGQDLPV